MAVGRPGRSLAIAFAWRAPPRRVSLAPMAEPGQRVMAPSADDSGEVEATLVEGGDPNEPVEVSGDTAGEGTIKRDVAWVRYDDGTMKAWPYQRIRPIE
jgi:hypothetical protein